MIPLIAISHALTPSGVVAWLDLTPSLRGDASYLRGNLRKNSKKCYGNYYFLDCRAPCSFQSRRCCMARIFDVIPVKTGTQPCLCHAELVSASIKRYPEINSG
ncbi:hypothetical protein [Rickettsia endosymbiont of Orchestes rusci]|uniref:hypothetical protein n=1 Tax=Rickettsia endosymbiont of Orchestes rusci TaxID=3066250 RepID=UPI00313BD5FF